MENLFVCDLDQTRCVALVCNLINVVSNKNYVCDLNDIHMYGIAKKILL